MKVIPAGSWPTTDNVIGALPITSNLMFTELLTGSGVATVVISGLPGVTCAVNLWVDDSPAVFVATTSNSVVPASALATVPVMVPVVSFSVNPGDNVPFSIVHVTGVLLTAVNLKFTEVPPNHVAVAGDVITGGGDIGVISTVTVRSALPAVFVAFTVKVKLP